MDLKHLTHLTSNAVPMSKELSSHWSFLRNVIADWMLTYSTLNVVMGPVYDYDSDTFADDVLKNGLVIMFFKNYKLPLMVN